MYNIWTWLKKKQKKKQRQGVCDMIGVPLASPCTNGTLECTLALSQNA